MAEFQVNGTTLYYEVHGDPNGKETIAFLNGVMASTSSWALLYPIFEKLGFRVVLHDFKGQLKSDKQGVIYRCDGMGFNARDILGHVLAPHRARHQIDEHKQSENKQHKNQ